MIEWAVAKTQRLCGYCGATIDEGDDHCEIIVPGLQQRQVRCAACGQRMIEATQHATEANMPDHAKTEDRS